MPGESFFPVGRPLKNRLLMAAEYALFKNPPRQGSNEEPQLHARIVPGRVIRLDRIAKEISSFSSFSSADIKGLLQAFSDQLVEHLEAGDEIDLEGFGHFNISLSCPKISRPEEVRAEDIRFKSVNFRCSKKITSRLETMSVKRKEGASAPPLYTPQQRKANILRHLAAERTLMSSDCMRLNACTRYMALKDLKELLAEGKIGKIGKRKITIYILKEKPEERG